jgi:hypothetical protein
MKSSKCAGLGRFVQGVQGCPILISTTKREKSHQYFRDIGSKRGNKKVNIKIGQPCTPCTPLHTPLGFAGETCQQKRL